MNEVRFRKIERLKEELLYLEAEIARAVGEEAQITVLNNLIESCTHSSTLEGKCKIPD